MTVLSSLLNLGMERLRKEVEDKLRLPVSVSNSSSSSRKFLIVSTSESVGSRIMISLEYSRIFEIHLHCCHHSTRLQSQVEEI